MKDIRDPSVNGDEYRALLSIAKSYSQAAAVLQENTPGTGRDRHAPYRHCAHHAIELFLSAFIIARGMPADQVAELRHSLVARADQAMKRGLTGIDVRTLVHLAKLDDDKEYLTCRYPADSRDSFSHPTRLGKTLCVVEKAVESQI